MPRLRVLACRRASFVRYYFFAGIFVLLRFFLLLLAGFLGWANNAHAQASAQDRTIISNLAAWSVQEPSKDDYAAKTLTCVASALEFNANAHLLAASRPDEAAMRAGLTGGPVSDAKISALRERQLAIWRATQSVGKMTYIQFATCLEPVPVAVEEVVVNCFDLGLITALAEVEKGRGASLNWTVETLQQMTRDTVPVAFLRRAIEAVFAQNAQATRFKAHRDTFSECLRSAL